MLYCYGVDMGGTTIKMGRFTQEGALLGKWEIPTRVSAGMSAMMGDIADNILEDMAKNGIAHDRVLGAAVGVAGPVEPNGYTESCVNLNLYDFNPNLLLPPLLGGIAVYTVNDANAAALGELWQGGGKGYQNMVFVTLGTGVGSGVILGGKILYGTNGLAGEIGHISINPEEPLNCNCGSRGCLDQMASATGIVRSTGRMLERETTPSVLRSMPDFSAKEVFDAAKAGDEIAQKALEYCLHFLGKCLAGVSHVIDPEIFVIGGGVSQAGGYLIEMTEKHFKKYLRLKKATAKFALASLGNDAGIYGCARLVLQQSNAGKGESICR